MIFKYGIIVEMVKSGSNRGVKSERHHIYFG